jgi:D-sedoheptulose 7-phosphate isomerase
MDYRKQIAGFIDSHKRLLQAFERDCIGPLERSVDLLIGCIRAGGCIYLCGNGGSAADAQHVAAELVGRFARDRKGLPAVALTTDTSILTSVSNDYTFEKVFSRQVEALVKQGDVLWAFSTSGTSKNVLEAVKTAKAKGASILGFTGKKNSPLEKMSDQCICVDGPTASVQEIHQIAYHILCDCVEAYFADKP